MIKSPCKNVCELDPSTGLCLGCKRRIDEISNWNFKDDKEKIFITKKIQNRDLSINKV
jgi:uncharacterized protein